MKSVRPISRIAILRQCVHERAQCVMDEDSWGPASPGILILLQHRGIANWRKSPRTRWPTMWQEQTDSRGVMPWLFL